MSNRGKSKHKSSGGAVKAVVITLVVLLLAAALTIVAAIGSKGFTQKHFKDWFNRWGKPAVAPEAPVYGKIYDPDGHEMLEGVTYAMPSAMAFYAANANVDVENILSPTITVTAQQSFTLNNIKVDWAITDSDGFDMSEYVSVTPETDGSLNATVQCLKPFPRQLTLKVTTRDSVQNTASCTLDYIKRVNGVKNISSGTDFTDQLYIAFNLDMSTGSTTCPFALTQFYFQIADDFQAEVKKYLTFGISFKGYSATDITTNEIKDYDNNVTGYSGDTEQTIDYNMFIEGFDDYDQEHKQAIYYAWWNAWEGMNKANGNKAFCNLLIDATITQTYQGQVLYTYTENDYVGVTPNYLSGESYGIDLAPNLTLNQNYVF